MKLIKESILFVGMGVAMGSGLAHASREQYRCESLEASDSVNAQRCVFKTQGIGASSASVTTMNFLALRGSVEETAYDHGRILAKEIATGTVPAVLGEIERALGSMNGLERILFSKIQKCVMDGYRNSVTPEFYTMHKRLYEGMVSVGENSLSFDALINASFAVELSIFADGFKKKLEENRFGALAELATQCMGVVPSKDLENFTEESVPNFKTKMGCTGISASSKFTRDGNFVFGRNFDSSMVGIFEKNPVAIMQIPPSGHRYVGVTSAGMHYSGGISGFNDAGIVVSTHELQTTEYAFKVPNRSGVTGPYMQNLILEKASSIDEAIALVKQYGHFGAWTIFIGDTKTNEIASLEFTGKNFAVARRVRDGARPQTNHFVAPSMLNANFEYSYNKTLESRSRLDFLDRALQNDRGNIDAQWVINMLASHTDNYVGTRSFGRTVTKAYGTMTHVMEPQKRIFWASLADAFPSPHSTFVGFEVDFDFDKNGKKPFRVLGFKRAQNEIFTQKPNWTVGLGKYTESYMAFRDRTEENSGLEKSINFVTGAINFAARDNVFELPYYYARARLNMVQAAERMTNGFQNEVALMILDDAAKDLDAVLAYGERSPNKVLPYEMGLAHLWRARVADLMIEAMHQNESDYVLDAARNEHYGAAKKIFDDIIQRDTRTFFVKRLIRSFYNSQARDYSYYKAKIALKDDIDFVTVE